MQATFLFLLVYIIIIVKEHSRTFFVDVRVKVSASW